MSRRGAPEGSASVLASEAFQPQDLVITLLGTYVRMGGPAGDPPSSSPPPPSPSSPPMVWSGGLVQLLGELGFSHGAARVALTRLVRRGLIERVRDGRLVHYCLTQRADRVLAEGDGRIFTFGHHRDDGGTWTLLWHQIPEDRRLERSRLGRRLRFLGFGSVQDSVWVSPHDHREEVEQLLEEMGVAAYATLFSARADASTGLSVLVSRAWDLTGLVERYEAFAAEFSPWMRRRARTRLADSEAFLVRTRLIHLFRGFPQLDPELPEELAPLSAPRSRAVETFQSLYEGLAVPSQCHFEAVTEAFAGGRRVEPARVGRSAAGGD